MILFYSFHWIVCLGWEVSSCNSSLAICVSCASTAFLLRVQLLGRDGALRPWERRRYGEQLVDIFTSEYCRLLLALFRYKSLFFLKLNYFTINIFLDKIMIINIRNNSSKFVPMALIVWLSCLLVGILFDLFPDAVTNVILSKQSLFQISKIVAVGGASSSAVSKRPPLAGDTFDDFILSPRFAIAKILSASKVIRSCENVFQLFYFYIYYFL